MMFSQLTTRLRLRLGHGASFLARGRTFGVWTILLSVGACRSGDLHGAGTPCDESARCRGPLQCVHGRCELPLAGSSGVSGATALGGSSTAADGGASTAGKPDMVTIAGTAGLPEPQLIDTAAGAPGYAGAAQNPASTTLGMAGATAGTAGSRDTTEWSSAAGVTGDVSLGGTGAAGAGLAGAAPAHAGSAASAALPRSRAALGERCVLGTDCLSKHCVDQFCCESDCTAQCKACDLTGHEGQCLAVQNGQPRGERKPCTNAGSDCGGICSGADTCSYPDASKICDRKASCVDPTTRREAMACDGLGSCLVPIDKACAPPNVCNVNTDGNCGPAVYTHVVAYYFNTCAVVSDGTLRCWGDNEFGQLGLVGVEPRLVPYLVPSQKNVRSVAIGYQFVCALLRDGQVNCWGTNFHGQLGCQAPVLYDDRQQCVAYPPGSNVVELIGNGETPCARLRDGTVQCWGRNDYGAVGDGTVGTSRFEPTTVRGVANASGISSGPWHACAVTAQGSVKCWGSNDWGQLGNGTTTSISVASMVKGIDGVAARAVEVAAYGVQTCVVLADGSMQCFGRNDHGELGNGETTNRTLPVAAQAPMTAVKVAVGGHFTCAMISPTSIQCWGAGEDGQLGDGTFTDSLSPVAVSLPSGIDFKSLVASDTHSCALSTTGRLWCWGGNDAGKLGIGTTAPSGVPVEIAAP